MPALDISMMHHLLQEFSHMVAQVKQKTSIILIRIKYVIDDGDDDDGNDDCFNDCGVPCNRGSLVIPVVLTCHLQRSVLDSSCSI